MLYLRNTHTSTNLSWVHVWPHTPGETRRNCSPSTCPLIFREELKLSDVLCRNTQLINSPDEEHLGASGRFHSNTKQNSEKWLTNIQTHGGLCYYSDWLSGEITTYFSRDRNITKNLFLQYLMKTGLKYLYFII